MATLDDPMLPMPIGHSLDLPRSPPNPDQLMEDVAWHLQNIYRWCSVDDAHTGYEFDSTGALLKVDKPVGRFSMEEASTRHLLALCPVLRGSRANSVVLAYFLAFANAVSELLLCTGGDWFRAPAFMFLDERLLMI